MSRAAWFSGSQSSKVIDLVRPAFQSAAPLAAACGLKADRPLHHFHLFLIRADRFPLLRAQPISGSRPHSQFTILFEKPTMPCDTSYCSFLLESRRTANQRLSPFRM